jgi:tRNA A37 threonylcarbamoyladenosine modification protein TsaB
VAQLVIANASSFAIVGLLDDRSGQIIAEKSWTSDESKDVSSGYSLKIEEMLTDSNLTRLDIKSIVVVNGPGTFTGLRNSMSFSLGLSQSLQIPLRSLTLFDIYQRPVFIPTRHQAAKLLNLGEAIAAKLEFIKVQTATSSEVCAPQENDFVLGLKNSAEWPKLSEISKAIQAGHAQQSDRLEINYGLNPKISGVR